jgi:hypothetical protein
MKRLGLVVLLMGCDADAVVEVAPPTAPHAIARAPTPSLPPTPPPSEPTQVIDLSDDVVIIQLDCDANPDAEACADEIAEVHEATESSDDIADVQDRCPDEPEGGDGDIDGCPEPAPME